MELLGAAISKIFRICFLFYKKVVTGNISGEYGEYNDAESLRLVAIVSVTEIIASKCMRIELNNFLS